MTGEPERGQARPEAEGPRGGGPLRTDGDGACAGAGPLTAVVRRQRVGVNRGDREWVTVAFSWWRTMSRQPSS